MASGRISLVTAMLLCSASAVAQTVPAPSASAPDPTTLADPQEAPTSSTASEGGLSDIVITARRRVESAQNVPVSVTAFSTEQIQLADLTSLEKVSAVTPSFTVARSTTGSGAQISIRGIGSDARSIGLEQSVSVIVDGVYYGNGRIINEGFFDLAGIEILKGPQALFFGKNATAGVVSITTASPASTPEFLSRVGYEFNAQRPYAEFVASGPITETLGARFAVRGSQMFGSFVDNQASAITYTTRDAATGVVTTRVAPPAEGNLPGEAELVGRLTLQWDPSDDLTVTLKGSATESHFDGPGWNNLIFYCPRGTSALNANNPCGRRFVTYQNDLPYEIGASLPYSDDGELFLTYSSRNVTGTVAWDLGPVALTSITNYNRTELRFLLDGDYQSGTVQTAATERSTFRQFSNETRLLSDFDGPINALVGFYFQDTARYINQIVPTGNAENSAATPAYNRFVGFEKLSETDGQTLSGYGQLIWTVVPTVELTGGVRYINETKNSYFVQPYVAPTLLSAYAQGRTLRADQEFNNFSPEATLTWRPTETLTVYGAYKTAYKSGGFNNSGTLTNVGRDADFAFGPEQAKGFEVGIKGTLFDRQLRFDITAYDFTYEDLQIDFFNAATFAEIATNAGSAKATGVELQLEVAPRALDGFTLRGAVNYNNARYDEFIAPCWGGQTPAQGCNTTFLGGVGQDLSGEPTSVAPRWTGALGAAYQRPLGGGTSFGLAADAHYSDDYLGSPLGNPLTRQPSYVTLDVTARLLFDQDRLEVALIGKNLTNRFIFTGALDAPSTGTGTGTPAGIPADQRGYVLQPRTVHLQVTYRY